MVRKTILIMKSVIGSFGSESHVFLVCLLDPFGVIDPCVRYAVDGGRHIEMVQKSPSSLVLVGTLPFHRFVRYSFQRQIPAVHIAHNDDFGVRICSVNTVYCPFQHPFGGLSFPFRFGCTASLARQMANEEMHGVPLVRLRADIEDVACCLFAQIHMNSACAKGIYPRFFVDERNVYSAPVGTVVMHQIVFVPPQRIT